MKILKNIFVTLLLLSISLASCSDYLDVLPKGKRIPQTLGDYEALLRDEYTIHKTDILQASLLMQDNYQYDYYMSYYPLRAIHYMWNESENRHDYNTKDEATYYGLYGAISVCNLILENVGNAIDATANEINEVKAYATVIRAMCYYTLSNYYADAYEISTSESKKSIPLIESATLNAPYEQVSIKKIYDYMVSTVENVLEDLPKTGMTILHPSKGAAYAFLSRVYLQMAKYDQALKYADLALAENDRLYDWIAFYNEHQSNIEDPNSYTTMPSPMGFDYVENYNFRHGTMCYSSNDQNIPVHRAELFEEGDAKALARWKYRVWGSDKYMSGMLKGFFNLGGMTTVEVYMIKAECLARADKISEAMSIVNKVRKTRILPSFYSELSATTKDEAIPCIFKIKRNELINTIVPFADAKRLNSEGKWPITLTKNVDGVEYELTPESHLWTMTFPLGAVKYSGNGTITQNVDK